MNWTRSQCIGLSDFDCAYCHGMGTREIDPRRRVNEVPCNCVFRGAFRACLMRFRECSASGGRINTMTWEICNGRLGHRVFANKAVEFMADFELIARRCLDQYDYDIFRLHFLHGAEWRQVCAVLKITRGNCFHAIYRIQQILGRAYAEIEPYGLWPLDEYFGGVVTRAAPRVMAG